MKLYIYNADTLKIIATVTGETNNDCESKADALNLDQDTTRWQYSDNGLIA